MPLSRRTLLIGLGSLGAASAGLSRQLAAAGDDRALSVLRTWYRLTLELVRHTATYSPPVASRAFAYLGVTGFEAVASGSASLCTLAGQLNGLEPLPAREEGRAYDDAVVLQAALSDAVESFFSNTGPTGQRAMASIKGKLDARASAGVAEDVAARSRAHGEAVARHILDWSRTDGGAVVENMGFPLAYQLTAAPGHWVPTSKIAQQQAPLLPHWGENRAFALKDGDACGLPPPPAYSEAPDSPFYAQVREVFETRKALTDEQRLIARFWSDDPMLSPTPPGHWISIALQALKREDADLARCVETLARLGVALSDSFVACWREKYRYDVVRPVTVIRKLFDPQWESLMTTPPFPEYPSGHSTQSAAAAVVLTRIFGADFAFDDATHADDGLAPRRFPSFEAAAEEAGISRLYGGIHFRSAIEAGLAQGRCVGAFAAGLKARV